MKQYSVFNNETGYSEVFYTLPTAKKAMQENNAKGIITKIFANGDWENCGEIKMKGTNKTFLGNTKQKDYSYN